MTTDVNQISGELEIEDELADYFGPEASTLGQVDWRSNVPEGTVLGEAVFPDADGGQSRVQLTKGDSMVRLGGKKLPERTRVWDTRTGVPSDVATAQIRQQLAKRRSDGSRVYALKVPAGVEMPEPIKDTCHICLKSRNGRPKNFYSEDDLVSHYETFHEKEWNTILRDRDRKERREDATRLERLILGLVMALKPDAASSMPADVREQIESLQDATRAFAEEIPLERPQRVPRRKAVEE